MYDHNLITLNKNIMWGYNGNNAANQRLELENAKIALAKAEFTPEQIANAVLTQSELRLEVLLSTTGTNFYFPVLINDVGSGLVRKTEIRLKQQDAFYASGMKIELIKASSATAVDLKPLSYPNAVTFPTGEAQALYAFYNGTLEIAVNNSILVPNWPLTNSLNVPETQLTAATNSPQDEYYGVDTFALQPNPVFIGQKGNKITLTLPGAIGTALTGNVYARLTFRGILAQNVTVVS